MREDRGNQLACGPVLFVHVAGTKTSIIGEQVSGRLVSEYFSASNKTANHEEVSRVTGGTANARPGDREAGPPEARLNGVASHETLERALTALDNLEHRGACGCETNTGDGAGVLIQMPHAFLREITRRNHLSLPAPGEYGSGLIFLPRNPTLRRRIVEGITITGLKG